MDYSFFFFFFCLFYKSVFMSFGKGEGMGMCVWGWGEGACSSILDCVDTYLFYLFLFATFFEEIWYM